MVKQKKTKEELNVSSGKACDLKSKPTPEQLRVAQILEKKIIDQSVKLKLKQIMDATQRSADEVYVALHDSDFDADLAFDLLMEGKTQDDWCLSKNKKKKIQELKEKKTEVRVVEQNGDSTKPENNYGKRNDDRRAAGRNRGPRNGERPQRGPVDEQQSAVRERGFRGGRGPKTSRLPGTMVFERSSNQDPVQQNQVAHPTRVLSKAPHRNQWEKPLMSNNSVEEDWDNEEFTGSLSQTQIFTSSLKQDVSKVDVAEKTGEVASKGGMAEGLDYSNLDQPQQVTSLVVEPSMATRQPIIPAAASQVQSTISDPPLSNHRTYASLASDVYDSTVSTSLFSQAKEEPQEFRSSLLPPSRISIQTESRSDFLSRLTFPKNSSEHNIVSARKPVPSKIPTTAVVMPPETKPSLTLLDIEFGAMDLGPSATDTDSSESFTGAVSQSPSTTGLILPSSVAPSSGNSQFSRSMSNPSSSITSTSSSSFLLNNSVPSINNHVTQSSNPTAPSGSSLNSHFQSISNQIFSPVATTTSSIQSLSGMNSHHLMSQNGPSYSSSASSLGLMTPPNTIPSSSVNHVTLGHMVVPAPAHLTSAAPNHLSSAAGVGVAQQSHNMMSSSVSSQPVTQSMGVGRYMSSSNQQSFNTGHLPYAFMSSAPFDSRPTMQSHHQQHETITSLPPPHMSQPPPLPPPFKHPPGIPKSNNTTGNAPPLVANLPPPMVNPNHHQYVGNVPYFSHQPFFYYEEIPSVLNSQTQRLAAHHHLSPGYDTSNYHHQATNSSSNRDGVHYNV